MPGGRRKKLKVRSLICLLRRSVIDELIESIAIAVAFCCFLCIFVYDLIFLFLTVF